MRTDWGLNGILEVVNDVDEEVPVTLVFRLAANLTGKVRITLEVVSEEAIKT